jgi:hypothetical protein
MNIIHLGSATRYVAIALCAAAAVCLLATPTCALICDPKGAPPPARSSQQVEKEMAGPKVAAPVAGPDPVAERVARQRLVPKLPAGGDSQAVLAVTNGMQGEPAQKAAPRAAASRPNHMVAVAVTAAILGLICLAAMLAVRKGPEQPQPIADEEDGAPSAA